MENKKIVYTTDNKKIEIREIMSFNIDLINKNFVAYTINDDGISEDVEVNLVEVIDYDKEKPIIKKIEANELELVTDVFNKLLKG